jgi:hypothetical protein
MALGKLKAKGQSVALSAKEMLALKIDAVL